MGYTGSIGLLNKMGFKRILQSLGNFLWKKKMENGVYYNS